MFREHIRTVVWRIAILTAMQKKFQLNSSYVRPLHRKRQKDKFLTEFWFTKKWSLVQKECGFDKRTRRFRRIRKIESRIAKRNYKEDCFFRKPFSTKWPSVHVEVSSEIRAEVFFRWMSDCLCLKSKSRKKVELCWLIPLSPRKNRLYA